MQEILLLASVLATLYDIAFACCLLVGVGFFGVGVLVLVVFLVLIQSLRFNFSQIHIVELENYGGNRLSNTNDF